jgi:hypothetical protein
MKNLIFITLFCSSSFLIAQTLEPFECEVIMDSEPLKYPFVGGFSAPQWSGGDFNGDGIQDLFIFDRAGVAMVFLYDGVGIGSQAYSYSRDYNSSFPPMENWAILRDYDRDGFLDIYSNPSQGISGAQLHRGTFENNKWSFEPIKVGGADREEAYIFIDEGSGSTNVYFSFTDTPEIIDVDGDGDLDILSFEPGGAYLSFYRNLQVENNLPATESEYETGDFCFGKFKESGVSSDIILSTNGSCASGLQDENEVDHKLHAGSTIMAFDNDNDGDLEVVLGDLVNNNLVYLENGGTAEEALMTSVDTRFPSYNLSVDMPVFLGSYNVDVDGDGLKDLLASPNVVSSAENVNNAWYYKNTGDPNNRFEFRQNDLIVEEMVDLGSYSAPAFIDYNGDGLQDIIVGSGGRFDGSTTDMSLFLFENTGSLQTPKYELVDDDYLDFSAFATTSRNPSPTIGDLDGDGDNDMLMGEENGYLYYFENTAGPDAPVSFSTPIYQYMDILVGQKSRPFIVDLNEDGLMDIVVGQRKTAARDGMTGNINYFENVGEVGNPQFVGDILSAPNIAVLGGMTTREGLQTSAAGASAPFIIKQNDGYHFYVGAQEGFVSHFVYDGSDIEGTFERIDSTFGDIDESRWSIPTMADVDGDGMMEMLVGNFRGGLSFYNTFINDRIVSTADLPTETSKIFPNPAGNILNVELSSYYNVEYRLLDMNGRVVKANSLNGAQINLSDLMNGMYLIELRYDNRVEVQKFIKI